MNNILSHACPKVKWDKYESKMISDTYQSHQFKSPRDRLSAKIGNILHPTLVPGAAYPIGHTHVQILGDFNVQYPPSSNLN